MSMPKRNKSGCLDLTAKEALDNVSKVEKKLKTTETQEQRTLFEWAELCERKYPELRYLYHIPNGGSRHPAEAANLKRQGVKPGVPDICLPVSRRGYHGLYIELKAYNGRISDSQTRWINWLKTQGHYAVVAYGFDEAKGFIEWYLGGDRE